MASRGIGSAKRSENIVVAVSGNSAAIIVDENTECIGQTSSRTSAVLLYFATYFAQAVRRQGLDLCTIANHPELDDATAASG